MDAEATDAQIAQATELVQFSNAFFDLIDDLGEEAKPYLAEERELIVVLRGKAYRILPTKR